MQAIYGIYFDTRWIYVTIIWNVHGKILAKKILSKKRQDKIIKEKPKSHTNSISRACLTA